MSQAGTLSGILKKQLNKYDKSTHKAIVETFCECVGEWDDDFLLDFLKGGYGISQEADAEIKIQIGYTEVYLSDVDWFN